MRLAVLVLLFAVITPIGVVWWYMQPEQLIPVVEEALFESTGCHATVKSAKVSTSGEITLEGVTLRVPGAADPFAEFMTIERIEMVGEVRGLIDGSYRPSRIDLIKPVLYLTEQIETGLFNYELLTAPEGGDAERPIPQITIRDGQICFNQLQKDGIKKLGVMGVKGELSPDPREKKAYVFKIAETDAPNGAENIIFTGGFDLKKPSLDMQADNFRFSEEQRYFLPGEFRRWWTRLSPTGEVPTMSLALRPNEFDMLDLHEVRLKLVDIGINLNVMDFDDPEQRDIALLLRTIKSRLTKLSGEVVVDQKQFTLDGTGLIEQRGLGISTIAYSVNASGGINEGDPFKVNLKTQPFTLSERYQFGLAFSPLTGEGYRRFRPSGRFELAATLDSPGGDSEVDWGIDLKVLKGRMTHTMFPIPLRNVQGNIRIAPDRVDIGPMTAVATNGAKVNLEGFAQPASDVAEVKLDINIKGLPIDDTLAQALDPGARENIGRFFDQAAYDRLIKAGQIVPLDYEEVGDSNDMPRFTLGGTCDVYVPVHRPFGEGKDYSVTPVIQAKGLSLLMSDFVYPVTATGGRVTLGSDFVNIDDLKLVGPTGGTMTLNGTAKKGDDGEYRPQVSIRDAKLPIDNLLLASLGDEAEALMKDLRVLGRVEAKGEVYQGPEDDEPQLALQVGVKDASTQPYGGRVKVDNVQGSFMLRDDGLEKLALNGTRGEAKVGIVGSVDWSKKDETTSSLSFIPMNMRWSEDLVDVLPPDGELRGQLADLYKTYQPEGKFNAKIDWATKGEGKSDDFTAVIEPSSLAMNLLGGRMSYTNMSGRVIVYDELMQLDKLKGSFVDAGQADGAGVLEASGDIGFDKNPRIGLTFTGRAHTVSPTTRLLLPDTVNSIIDSIGFEGLLGVDQAQLVMNATGSEQQATDFEANFAISDAKMKVGGVTIEGFQGALQVEVDDESGPGMPTMTYALSADEMQVIGRKVEKFRIAADNKKDPYVLRAGRGTGSLYRGTVVLEASIDLGDKKEAGGVPGVRLNASIHDVALKSLLKPAQAKPQPENSEDRRVVQRDQQSGLVSGALLLDTAFDPDGPRYGRGGLRFRDAVLLSETPLGLLLLQTINLNFPDQRGFDRGAATFDIMDNTVNFRSMWMENRGTSLTPLFKQSLRVSGSGTMTFPDTKLDLQLRTQTTGTTENLPFISLFDELMNEIAGIQVKGTLEKPEVSWTVLRNTRDALSGGKNGAGKQ